MQQPSLLPEEFVNETRERRTGLLAAVLFPLVLAAVVGAFFVTNRQWSQVRDAQAAVDEQTTRVAAQIGEMRSLERIRAEMGARSELARGLLEPVPRSLILAILVQTMPNEITLTAVEIRSEEIRPPKEAKPAGAAGSSAKASGKPTVAKPAGAPVPRRATVLSIGGLAPSLHEVGRWMSALEQVPMFASVRLELMEEVVGGEVVGGEVGGGEVVGGQHADATVASEFRIAIRIESETTIHEWDGLEAFRSGVLPESFASAGGAAAGDEAEQREIAP
jgi:Tfp pilus assembly protein PilN